jgi:hypothetical protein
VHFNHEFYIFSDNVSTGIEELLSIVIELKLPSMMCELELQLWKNQVIIRSKLS